MATTGLESFRQVGGGRIEHEIISFNTGHGEQLSLRKSGVSGLASRFMGWIRGTPEGPQHGVASRADVKQEFLTLLAKTEGWPRARSALRDCGLPDDWGTNSQPLTNRLVSRILDKAQELRMGVVRHNDKLLADALRPLQGPEHRDLRAAIKRAVQTDPRYGSVKLTGADIAALRAQAETAFRQVREQQCLERFPELSSLVVDARTPGASPEAPFRDIRLDSQSLVHDLRQACERNPSFRDGRVAAYAPAHPLMKLAFDSLETTTGLLRESAWDQDGLKHLSQSLDRHYRSLADLSLALLAALNKGDAELANFAELTGEDAADALAASTARQALMALKHEVDHQMELVEAKQTYVDEMRLTDPLSTRSVKHSNLVWARAGLELLNRLAANADGQLTDAQQSSVQIVRNAWVQLDIPAAEQEYASASAPDALAPIAAPSKENKSAHPIVAGKRHILDELRHTLQMAGVPENVLEQLFSKQSLRQAERASLSTIDTWQPVDRKMEVMRDGVMRTYRSQIIPAQFIHPDLGVNQGGVAGGISAGVKDSQAHARNLKVSKLLDPDGNTMTTVVGHGVLDMWGVEGRPQRQQANAQGAREVLEVALSSNRRMHGVLTDPTRAAHAPPPRQVHVSVNLISPDSVRTFIGDVTARAVGKDFQEETYTFNQFRAFDANSGPGQPLRVFTEGSHQVVNSTVDVDTITFSFGINAIATGTALPTLMGTWDNVHQHNTRNMIKLIGDLGEGKFGARGVLPGGFIGQAYGRLQAWATRPGALPEDARQAEKLMAQLRGQTDLVRAMFTEKTFQSGHGDPAKMGREILVLQGLAEQALDLADATDLCGTMSKGCKSDKDRGGVTDVELKSKLILRDMGGEMNPDEALQGDDQEVYYTVSASSGQLENQRWNTGMAGSKEAGHLERRLPLPEARQFLCGLGKLAQA